MKQPTLDEIEDAVRKAFDVGPLAPRDRRQRISDARLSYYYLGRKAGYTMAATAGRINRDHSNCTHADREVPARLGIDKVFCRRYMQASTEVFG